MSNWTKKTEKEIEKIKNWKLKDRLSIVAALTYCNSSVASSVSGWSSWLTNALIMEEFSEEELKEIFQELAKLAIEWLKLDLKYTKLLLNKKGTKDKFKKIKVENYVS